jgi:hypothetical protein
LDQVEAHIRELEMRIRLGNGKAAVAVAWHLAEANWWVLTTKQVYREPAPASMSSSENGSAR